MKHLIILFLFCSTQVFIGQTTNLSYFSITEGTQVSIVKTLKNNGTFLNDGDLHLHSHLLNNGTFTFLSGMSSTSFTGIMLQKIGGESFTEINNLFVNNTSVEGIQLHNSISIFNEVDFTNGIIHNTFGTANAFTFLRNATAINTSDSSHIIGDVEKIGDTDFEYPIGNNAYYRKVKIYAPDTETDLFTATYVYENSDIIHLHQLKEGVIELIDTNEYWKIRRDAGSSNVLIRLTWNENTTSAAVLAGQKTAIHIVRWDEEKGFWVDEGGVVDEANKTVTTIATLSNYGIFTLARVKEELVLPGGCLTVYNTVTSNGDGVNDILRIKCIEDYPNTIEIFNRWGARVYTGKDYNNETNYFSGFSEGKSTVFKNKKLPEGTYYYILNYQYNGTTHKKAGYLYLK